jgi:hypothetical protein
MRAFVMRACLSCFSLLFAFMTCAAGAAAPQPRLQWEGKVAAQAAAADHEPKACNAASSAQPTRYEALNDDENGDKLAAPRQIAAAIVAQGGAEPKLIDDVGAYQSEFLEAFLERFHSARGLWTASTNANFCVDKARLARFGDRVTYNMNCPAHDFTDGCVAKNADVILVSWLSSHHDIAGISGFYGNAGAQLPVGGWVASLDHVRIPDEAMAGRIKAARQEFHAKQEGGPQTAKQVATLEEQMAALKAAGFHDAQVVWSSFDVVLIMAQKQ